MIVRSPRLLALPAKASPTRRNGSAFARSAPRMRYPQNIVWGTTGADPRPSADRDLRRGSLERATGVGKEAADVDVELVLAPDNYGVHDKGDVVALRRASVPRPQECARAPCGVEIIRRLRRLQERVLDPGDPSRRDQDRLILQRRPQDDIAARLAIGNIDLEAGKRCAGQLVIGDAGAHDLPQSHAMELHGVGGEGRRHRENDRHRKNSPRLCAARHGLAPAHRSWPFLEHPGRLA